MDKKYIISKFLFFSTFLFGGIGAYLILAQKFKPQYGVLLAIICFVTYISSEIIGKYKNEKVSQWSKKFSFFHIMLCVIVILVIAILIIINNR